MHSQLRLSLIIFTAVFAVWLPSASAAPLKPIIVSTPNSTRAVAFDAVAFTPEPFAAKGSSLLYGSPQNTRIMVFLLNCPLEPNENASTMSASAEATGFRHWPIQVEYVGKVQGQDWLTLAILRLEENMVDLGDVLFQVSHRGVLSNRVRIGIGSIGGGPPDDAGAAPTPAPPYRITGRITLDQVGLGGITVNQAGSSSAVATTSGDGTYSFDITSVGDYSITPVQSLLKFTPIFLETLSGNRTINFAAAREILVISGVAKDEAGNGVDGVPVKLESEPGGPAVAFATTNGGGNFSFNVPALYDYTITPQSDNLYTFTSQSVADLGGNVALSFSGVLRRYAISGTVLDQAQHGLSGVAVTLSGGATGSTSTDANGNYSFSNLPAGRSYTVNAAKQYFTLAPSSGAIPNLINNADAINFAAARNTFVISGNVKDSDGLALNGAVVRLESNSPEAPARTLVTSGAGNFSFDAVPAGFDYTVTAQNTSLYAFTSQSVTAFNGNLTFQFNATLRRYTIRGIIRDQTQQGLAGAAVTLSGGASGAAVTDAGGNYEFSSLPAGGTFTVAAAKTNYFVSPTSQALTLFQDESINFNAVRFYILSGRVADGTGRGLRGISVTLTGPQGGHTTTTPEGNYSFTVTAPGNYTLTPSWLQDFYQYSPPSRTFNNLSDHQMTNFAATVVVSAPTHVLEFDGTPKNVDYGVFWPTDTVIGQFFWEVWAMPAADAASTYMISDGYGGAHVLLFGFNAGPPGRYTLLGNVWTGTQVLYYNSDEGPSPGEWGHFAVGWDGHNIITYYDGVPVGKQPFTGPRVSTGTYNGSTLLFVGGSNHQNLKGRIAQIRGFEESNPRAGSSESAFVPETVFSVNGQFLTYYFRPNPVVADLSPGYNGGLHIGWLRSMENYFNGCPGCPTPQFVIDSTAPNFCNPSNPGQTSTQVDSPAVPPAGIRVFDSFSRNNSTYILNGKGGLGSTETGAAAWQTNVDQPNTQPFGILAGRAVVLANTMALAWVPVTSATGNLDVRVSRTNGSFGSGRHTGLCFRVVDKNNFFFAHSKDDPANPSGAKRLTIGYYQGGVKTILADNIVMPAGWITLRVVTRGSGAITVFADGVQVHATSNALNSLATGSGLFNHGAGMSLHNRWDSFMIFDAP